MFRSRGLRVVVLAAMCILLPVRQAEAFLAPAAAVPVLITAGGPVTWTAAALSALVAGGVAILAINFPDVLRIDLNPKSPAPVPPGWTASPTVGFDPVPPGTMPANAWACSMTGGYSGSATAGTQASCALALIATLPTGPFACDPASSVSYAMVGANIYATYSPSPPCSSGVVATVSGGATCATGYTLSGATCILTSPTSVNYPTDGSARKKLAGGEIGDDPRDPDNTPPAPAPGVIVTTSPTQTTVTVGNTTTTVKVNADGSVTTSVRVGNGDGTSTTTSLRTAPGNPAAPDGGTNAVGSSVSNGTGEGTTTEPEGGVAEVVTCTNCATEPTAQAIKNTLNEIKTDGVKIKEGTIPTGTGAYADHTSGIGITKTSLTDAIEANKNPVLPWGWSFSFPSLSCTPWNMAFSVGGHDYAKSVEWCGYFGTARTLWAWCLSVLTGLYVWRLFAASLWR